MNVSIEDVSPVEKKISVTIPADKVRRELDRAYSNLQNQVMLKGFRRGKVPRQLLEARFRSQIEGEVSSRLVSESLDKTIDENKIFMVSRPTIDMGDLRAGDFSFTATVEVKPALDAQGYDGLAVTREVYELDEKIIDNELEQLRRRHGSYEPVEEDRGLQEGDVAILTYTLSIAGAVVEGPIENFQVELRSEAMLPGFAAALYGMKVGDERSFDLDAPANVASPVLAGKSLHFDVKLAEIKKLSLPALDDDFARDMEAESLEALREKHRTRQRAHLDENSAAKLRYDITSRLIELNPVDLPKGLVTQSTDRLVRQRSEALRREGLGDEAGAVAASERESLRLKAMRQLNRTLVLESIAEKEGVSVEDADVSARFARMARETGQRPEALKGLYMKNGLIDDLKNDILQEKALDLVVAKATVTDVHKTYAEHSHDHDDHGHEHDHG